MSSWSWGPAPAATLTLALLVSGGVAWAQEPDPARTEEERATVREKLAQVDIHVDALEAEVADVQAALAELEANVAAQEMALAETERAAETAAANLEAATAAVADAQRRYDKLDRAADRLLVDSFMHPPSDAALEPLRAGSLVEAAIMQAVVEMQATSDARILERLEAARAKLEAEEANKQSAADAAADAEEAAAEQLAALEGARAQQRDFAAEVEARLDAKLAEAAALEALDKELSERLVREQEELAAQLAAAQQERAESADEAPSASSVTPAPGGLATVSCPAGGSITVAGSIAANVQALLDAAAADGIMLCGSGYRDPADQIALREAHCGTSYYAIYEMPASQCSPPTARPGTSMHEQGLAIDFTCNGGGTVSSGDVCYSWLQANAASYGLYNLPSEPWHWSTNGN